VLSPPDGGIVPRTEDALPFAGAVLAAVGIVELVHPARVRTKSTIATIWSLRIMLVLLRQGLPGTPL